MTNGFSSILRVDENKHQRILVYLIWVMMLGMIFSMKMTNVLLVTITAMAILYWYANGRVIAADRLTIFTILYFAIEVVGLTYTDRLNLGKGFAELETHLPFILVPILFLNFRVDGEKVTWGFYVYLVGCFLATVYCVYTNFRLSLAGGTLFDEVYFSYERVSEPIGLQAVYFALYISLAILIVLDLLLFEPKPTSSRQKFGLALLACYFTLILVASGARTAIVAVMALATLNLIMYAKQRKAYKMILVGLIVPTIFLVMIFLNPVVLSRFVDLTYNTTAGTRYDSYFARTYIWRSAAEAIADNVWFGVGTGDQQQGLLKSYEKNEFLAGIEFTYNAHNQYLQTMLALGIPGLLALLAILAIQFNRSLKKGDVLQLSFTLLFAFAFITESILSRSRGVVIFLFFAFLLQRRKVL